ncbi:hypothetical protein MJ1_0247 [Nanobdella aerobiophila]|uniref:DsrE/DsrF-like family protein n=1 Tax=Nanobdella aerobiophila TaxID=2586965 RepID=A0A915SCI5_9ARCH|nr:DsrE family protein [Nanobdella aerobiophila]BBL45418.1 hypothetical protein MJ1_0247 [Nanobdella aerobiophila]
MAKYVILFTKEDKNSLEKVIEFSKALKSSGAEDVKLCFTLEGIKMLDKRNEEYKLIISRHLQDLNKLNIKVNSCKDCSLKYNIDEENIIYKDEIFSFEVLNKLVDQGYHIITF